MCSIPSWPSARPTPFCPPQPPLPESGIDPLRRSGAAIIGGASRRTRSGSIRAHLAELACDQRVEGLAVQDLDAIDHLHEGIAREAEVVGLEHEAIEVAVLEVDQRPEGEDQIVLLVPDN